MSTATMGTTTGTGTYRIMQTTWGEFTIEGPDGMLLRNKFGDVRYFLTRAAARKRISREKSGDFHA